jgi:hypothetical protein
LTNGRVNGQQLQTMRILTPASANLVEATWNRTGRSLERELARLDRQRTALGAADRRATVLVRAEQQRLRQYLFGLVDVGQCALCNCTLPVGLLVAAHIKARAKCIMRERNDYQYNIFPLCSLGCDALFERGYLVVANGAVARGPAKPLSPDLVKRLTVLHGKIVSYYNKGSAVYFRWHARHAARIWSQSGAV